MKLSGGNYGGYDVENDNILLYENGVVVDTQAVTVDGINLVVNGWVYSEDGIFLGNE